MNLWISVLTCTGGEPYVPDTLASIRSEWDGPIHLTYSLPGPPDNLSELEHFYNPVVHPMDHPHPRVSPDSMVPSMTRKRVALGHQRAIQVALDSNEPWTHFLMCEDDVQFLHGWSEELASFELAITNKFMDRWALWVRKHPGIYYKEVSHLPGVGEMNPSRHPLIGNVAVLYPRAALEEFPAFIDRKQLDHYVGPLDMQTRYYFRERCYRALLTILNLANHHGVYSRRSQRMRRERFL